MDRPMMIPNRIKQYFLLTDQRQNGENTLVSGRLQCCEQPAFSLSAVGTVQRGLLHRMSLYPSAEGLALRAACARCGRDIPAFDAGSDGYGNSFSKAGETPFSTAESIQCIKCGEGPSPWICVLSIPTNGSCPTWAARTRATPSHGCGCP